jgi:hypothetical protein
MPPGAPRIIPTSKRAVGRTQFTSNLKPCERHPLAPENAEFPFDIREKPVGLGSRPSYRAVFTIQENVVLVLTVQRGAQDALRPEDIGVDPA